jgi:hypothetical protein
MEKTFKIKGREKEWCPGADLNHRHADFQSAVLPIYIKHLPRPCGIRAAFTQLIRFQFALHGGVDWCHLLGIDDHKYQKLP